jgi:hypothetical protein
MLFCVYLLLYFMKLTEILNLSELELAEAMTGPEFYNQLVSPKFKPKNTFPVKLNFDIDNKSVEVVIPIKLEMDNLKKEVDDYLKAPPELKQKLDTYAYWYDNFNKLIFQNMGETDACLFLAACAYCSANTALDQNILEAAKLYKAVSEDSKTSEGINMLGQLSANVKNNMDAKSLEYLKTFQNKGSNYADLLVPKKDYKGGKVAQGARKGQDDIFSEITVANAKIPNFNLFVKYYLANRTKINKDQLYKDLQSGVLKIGGTKINSFFLNLVFPGKKWEDQIDPATVDRWMIRVFFDKPLQKMVEEDVSEWIEYLSSNDKSDGEIDEATGKPKKPKKPKLSPEEIAVAKKIAELKKKQDSIINKVVMKLFGDDVVRQNLVKILHEEAQKVGLTSYQLQALAWVNIRIRYQEPAAKFAKFEDVMEYAQDAAKNIMSINPDTNSVMNTIKILSSGPRFKFKNPQTVVDTIENASKYEKVYFLPPKIKKPATNKSNVDYAKIKVAAIDDTHADIYDLSVSKKKPVHTVQGTDRKSTLSQSLKWILSYNPTPATPVAVK